MHYIEHTSTLLELLAFSNISEGTLAATNVSSYMCHVVTYVLIVTGDFGRYQCFQFLLHLLGAMTAGMHMLSLVTVAAVPEHRCRIPGLDGNDSFGDWNSSKISLYIPKKDDGFDSCNIWSNATNTSQSCTSWVYDKTYFQTSRAVEWDFVCSRRWMGAASQSIYMFGVFTGAVLLGTLADK
uniref:Uncharacterized protein n=1 Tax=Timema poppense TaxID=170557 RepID=A0A7R9DLL1_TIMPO|nr:unnamed protein product [Timema poppensis]